MSVTRNVDLEQRVPCPSCGWEHRAVDSADGLHAINRRCQRGACQTYWIAAFRGSTLVGTAELADTDHQSYLDALNSIEGLTHADRKRLVLTARDRALELR